VRNKIDLVARSAEVKEQGAYPCVAISARENLGLDLLKTTIKTAIGVSNQEASFSARVRHVHALERASQHLDAAYALLERHESSELIAEDLRQCQQALAEITGAFTSEDLLGRIFSSFCIGK
jgi:tRNA modification GTPase